MAAAGRRWWAELRPESVGLGLLLGVIGLAVGALGSPGTAVGIGLRESAKLGAVLVGVIVVLGAALAVAGPRWAPPPAGSIRATRTLIRLLVLVLIAAVGVAGLFSGDWPIGKHRPSPPPRPSPSPPPLSVRPIGDHAGLSSGSDLLIYLVLAIEVAVALVVIGTIFLLARSRRGREPAGSGRPAVGPDAQRRQLADALDAASSVFAEGRPPRDAILASYFAMQQSLAAAGATRSAADTPEDLLQRARAGGLVLPTEAAALTELFREARFSTHQMTIAQQQQAIAALQAIRATLEVRA